MALQTFTRRQATPQRWQAALRRALSDGVQLRQLSGSGAWIATSGSREDVAYEVDGETCTCEAALLGGDPVCRHRALYWFMAGVLDPEPDPPAPENVVPFRPRNATTPDAAATADKLLALVERMADLHGDAPVDWPAA
jgi:hypothetical protein